MENNEELSDKNKPQGFIQVDVAPRATSTFWSKFIRWVRKLSTSKEAEEKGRKVLEYFDELEDFGLEKLKNPKFANEKTNAEIQEILEKTRAVKEDSRRKSKKENLELEKISAEIRKMNAEAFQIETDTTMRVLKELENRGFQVLFSFDEKENKLIVADTKKIEGHYDERIDPVLLRPIDDLGLSGGLSKSLKDDSIYYIGDLIQVPEIEIYNSVNTRMLSEL